MVTQRLTRVHCPHKAILFVLYLDSETIVVKINCVNQVEY